MSDQRPGGESDEPGGPTPAGQSSEPMSRPAWPQQGPDDTAEFQRFSLPASPASPAQPGYEPGPEPSETTPSPDRGAHDRGSGQSDYPSPGTSASDQPGNHQYRSDQYRSDQYRADQHGSDQYRGDQSNSTQSNSTQSNSTQSNDAPANGSQPGYSQPSYGQPGYGQSRYAPPEQRVHAHHHYGQSAPQPSAYPYGPYGPQQPPATRAGAKEPGRGRLQFLAAVLIASLLGGFGGALAADQFGLIQGSSDNRTIETRTVLEGDAPHSVADVASAVMPSVVSLSVGSGVTGGVGSGFVVREDGYVVTNAHVVEPAIDTAMPITVMFANGDQYPAEIIGHDFAYDVAVVKIDAADLPVLEFGDSDELQVGEQVVAVGAPLGLDSTVTTGIVSATERPVMTGQGAASSFINAVQTDAAINPGNSGGPLVDLHGRVIGVNSAMAQIPSVAMSGTVGSIGLGFAIPSNQAQHTADQLIDTGSSDYPVIGILVDTTYTGEGARVATEAQGEIDIITPGGAAEAAGIEPGDLILEVDDRRITDSSHLIVVLRSYRIGDTVQVVVRNTDGDERTVAMTLQGSQP